MAAFRVLLRPICWLKRLFALDIPQLPWRDQRWHNWLRTYPPLDAFPPIGCYDHEYRCRRCGKVGRYLTLVTGQ